MHNNFEVMQINPHFISCRHFASDDKKDQNVKEYEAANYEIELMTAGEAWCICGGERQYVRKGNILMRRPRDRVYIVGKHESYLLEFDFYDDSGGKNNLIENPFFTSLKSVSKPATTREYTDFYILFKECLQLLTQINWLNMIALQSNLLRILYYFFRALPDENSKSFNPDKKSEYIVKQVQKYIEEKYAHSIKLQELADYVDLSPSHLGRLFRKVTGLAPLEYLIGVRLHYAKEMLTGTNLSIKEISYSSGFENISYFCTMFKKKIGTTPKEFRMKCL